MYKIICILTIVTLSGCSLAPSRVGQPTPDGWIVAADSSLDHVQVEVQRVTSVPVWVPTDIHIGKISKKEQIFLNAWAIRVRNYDTSPICAYVRWRYMDYDMYVPNGWIYLDGKVVTTVGYAIQKYWKLSHQAITLNDAKFGVQFLDTITPTNGQCVVKKKK